VFKRFVIDDAIHVASHGNLGEAFRVQKLFMDTLKNIKPITDDSYLFEYLKFGKKTQEVD
jgi:hypothetical protein